MQASQLFLLRACRNKGLAIVSLDDVEIVDKRLRQIYKAMSSSLELEHWKFEPAIKEAIAGSDQSFARLCQAAEGLASLVLLHLPCVESYDLVSQLQFSSVVGGACSMCSLSDVCRTAGVQPMLTLFIF